VFDDPGLPGTPDSDILEHAASQGRILVTENIQDFAQSHGELLAQNRSHPGILFVRSRTHPYAGEQLNRLVTAIGQTQQRPLASGQITFL
jgi:hypothetical protein